MKKQIEELTITIEKREEIINRQLERAEKILNQELLRRRRWQGIFIKLNEETSKKAIAGSLTESEQLIREFISEVFKE